MGVRMWVAFFLSIFSMPYHPPVRANTSKEQTISIVFINPSHMSDPYWNLVTRLMSAAAHDLGIEFEVFYSNGDRFIAEQKVQKVIKEELKPDYLIAAFPPGMNENVFKLLNSSKIPLLTLEPIYVGQKMERAHPEERSFWYREYTVDQLFLATLLVDPFLKHIRERPEGYNSEAGVFGITRYTDPLAIARRDKVNQILMERSAKRLAVEHVTTQSKDLDVSLIENFRILLRRFPKIRYLWIEGPTTTGTFLDALHGYGHIRDELLISSYDPILENLSGLEAGLVVRLIGGQYVMAVCAIVDAFDERHSIKINALDKEDRYLQVVEGKSARNYAIKLFQKDWEKLDFRQFSRFYATSPSGKAKKDCSNLKEYLDL
ncbi:MAG: hypothetical protein ACOH5I_22160 [Oligoflexus sp.]